ncbi:MAG: tRNA 2-thiouridine(34) synthase MnmA [Dehalococcoidales bacterium]|nr:tRNA 2-thiouridine(34) synthase MnmA [Dehalococcoidales bacterium]
MSQKRVAVAMSGGVDSSVAAALLIEAGYNVIGVYMQLWAESDLSDLECTCQILNIPFHVLDFKTEFQNCVIDYFCRDYILGRTPNPCIKCNQYVKFGLLLRKIQEMGADYLATGHYCRVEYQSGGYHLLRAVDRTKDQSYFLYTLGQDQLSYLLLPVGNLSKVEVRRIAAKLDLPASTQRDSQDVCFIADNDYRSFISKFIHLQPGDIVDATGKLLGEHRGLAQYTVGQRQGLGLTSEQPLYVISLDTVNNRLVVGGKAQLLNDTLCANQLSWVSGKLPEKTTDITAKIRYRSSETAVNLCLNNSTAKVHFQQPQWAITPGQAIVFYQGDIVLGGGTIINAETVIC